MLSRRAGLSATAGLSCYAYYGLTGLLAVMRNTPLAVLYLFIYYYTTKQLNRKYLTQTTWHNRPTQDGRHLHVTQKEKST